MPPPVKHSARLLRVAVAVQLVQTAGAVDGTWTNAGGGSWSDGANWAGNSVASGTHADAGFSTIDLIGNATITLNGARTIGSLVFGDANPSHDWFLRKGGGGVLTLDVANGTPVITVINRTATLGVDLAGNEGLMKSGQGTLVLSGSNTYGGPTSVSAGILRLGAPPAFPPGLQIMPIGDSITFGYNGANAGYRGPLYGLLLPVTPDFHYIGTSVERPGFLPADQWHNEGHSSYSIQDVNNNLDGFDNTIFLQYGGADRDPNGGYWFTGGNGTGRAPMVPDVITMMLGTNDLGNPTGVETRLRNLLAKITTQRPAARLLVGRITPVTGHPGVAPYNVIVSQVTEDFRAAGNHVFSVDLNTNFPADGLDPDGVHPNDTGFSWMAIQWYEALIEAYSPDGGPTSAIPAGSPVTVAQGASLDLNGTRASMATLSAAGNIDLGNGGTLTAANIQIQATGSLTGSGTIHGSVTLNGSGFGFAGQSLVFSDQVANNGHLRPLEGSSVHFGGNFVNNGVLTTGSSQTVMFSGSVTNNGILRVTDGASLDVGGAFINNGTLDILTGAQDLPAGFVNNGSIIDASAVKTHSVSTSGNTLTLTIQSYTGHIYQLQHAPVLATGSWVDLGAPQAGSTGTLLGFSAPRDSPSGRGFYRIRVSP